MRHSPSKPARKVSALIGMRLCPARQSSRPSWNGWTVRPGNGLLSHSQTRSSMKMTSHSNRSALSPAAENTLGLQRNVSATRWFEIRPFIDGVVGHSIYARRETFSEAKLVLTQFLESEAKL